MMELDINRVVLNTYSFFKGNIVSNESYHVAFAGTANYIAYLAMVILSIRKYNQNTNFTFHLFLEAITEADLKKVAELSTVVQAKIQVHLMNDVAFNGISSKKYPASYWYRLIMPDFLRKETKKVLYLDGDMMCHGNIEELFTQEVEADIVAGVVTDRNFKNKVFDLVHKVILILE